MKRKPGLLKTKMFLFMLLCWLLPLAIALGSMSYYIYSSHNRRINEELAGSLESGLRIAADRLDGAVSAVRRPGYDGSLVEAWQLWDRGLNEWVSLYYFTSRYLGNEYRSDERFPLVAFWYTADPEEMRVGIYVEEAGGSFQDLTDFWSMDYGEISDYAATLDTYAGFYEKDGRAYVVRNLVNRRFEIIGTQAMRIDTESFFEGLTQAAWGNSLRVWIDGVEMYHAGYEGEPEPLDIDLTVQSAAQGKTADGRQYCLDSIEGGGYTLTALILVDRDALLSEVWGYQSILVAVALLLWPLLFLFYRMYQRNITAPIEALAEVSSHIEQGEFGFQVKQSATNREFQYIFDSFNHMSGELRAQFDRLLGEELSLRDARIKALQSQINPHFLNNTLEIINWEARLGGNAKVSQMIEALSTLLDAAMSRDSRPLVRLSEELQYINAYLFIIDQRFGKRLTVTKEIDPFTLDWMVPRLILQPLVENAVEHGMSPTGQGRVELETRIEGDYLVLEVVNDGKMSAQDKEKIERLLSPDYDASEESSYNLGIANVNQRIRIIFGPESGLSIYQQYGRGVVSRVVLPREKSAPKAEE